ncbi:BrnA antitoxin family protein [Azorhizobium sp. AG788]|uniref:BrnA antitoxin family protein n=1 Tax=Azorhizobium sp. AG788 TaxID=2183897 RepID=UPI003139EF6D
MTAKPRSIGSDLTRVDAHTIGPAEYDDIPELDDAFFATALEEIAGQPVRRGRPPSRSPKQAVSLRLSPDVLEYFRSAGPGWQTRIDEALRKAAKL